MSRYFVRPYMKKAKKGKRAKPTTTSSSDPK